MYELNKPHFLNVTLCYTMAVCLFVRLYTYPDDLLKRYYYVLSTTALFHLTHLNDFQELIHSILQRKTMNGWMDGCFFQVVATYCYAEWDSRRVYKCPKHSVNSYS